MPASPAELKHSPGGPDEYGPVLAPYACDPLVTRGRLHPESESGYRSCYQRDRDRIIHSSAFRRLKHKTQVFVYHEGDYYRTRLTHSLEVAQIARTVARALGLNEDLAEALALAHDFGHTPFGHAGEDALDAAMAPFGGFDHNAQTLRILTKLEQRYPTFDGLNLTWETLEGVVKHNGPLTGDYAESDRAIPEAIAEYVADHDLELDTYASAEAQVAAISDDIAYNSHDIDDGLRAGLFGIADIERLPLVGPAFRGVRDEHGELDRARFIHAGISQTIGAMVADVLAETRRRLAEADVGSPEQVRALDHAIVGLSDDIVAADRAVKSFLYENMYRHHRVNRMTSKARRVVSEMFELLFHEPELLPTEWRSQALEKDEVGRARVIADYIAGMTDRYALELHKKLFDPEVL
ncbi:MAG: deoxyguanosinetriphosphate triphosphohydrolase [Alphaproteobacteria bacterium]|nr:deoxyguanosinetriphosphate triphosphohydrolase [Alphaproteobacteria bacterium]